MVRFVFLFFVFSSLGSMEHNLFAVVKAGHIENLKAILTVDAAKNMRDDNGNTLLHYAVTPAIAAYLLEQGADSNARGDNDATPLHYALWEERDEVAEYLIKEGAEVNCRNNEQLRVVEGGYAPLDIAISYGNTYMVALLLEYKADPNAALNEHPMLGWRSLHWACYNTDNSLFPYDSHITELLIDHGADIRLQNDNGFNAVHCAAAKDDKEFLRTILTRIPAHKIKTVAIAQAKKVRIALMRYFKKFREAGLPLLPKELQHMLLQYIIKCKPYILYNEPETTNRLIFNQVDYVLQALEQQDTVGRTPLQIAQIHRNIEYVDMLDPCVIKQLMPIMKDSVQKTLSDFASKTFDQNQ